MSAGFTPGPWSRRDTETHAEIDAPGHATLAMVATAPDADLIAAAPALYEALDDLANVLIKAFPSLANTPNLERAHEALKQARGEA